MLRDDSGTVHSTVPVPPDRRIHTHQQTRSLVYVRNDPTCSLPVLHGWIDHYILHTHTLHSAMKPSVAVVADDAASAELVEVYTSVRMSRMEIENNVVERSSKSKRTAPYLSILQQS